jgi:hypothetical protein
VELASRHRSEREAESALKKTQHKARKKSAARPVFDSIRKPLAPPGHALSHAKPEPRARPAMRKAKHKRPPAADEGS